MKRVVLLMVAVSLVTAVNAGIYLEEFTTSPTFTASNNVDNPTLTTTGTGGSWYKSNNGANYNLTDGTMRLVNPGGDGGISSVMIALDQSLFNGAGSYSLKVDFTFADDGATRLFADVWDVDYGTGTVTVQTLKWATWNGGDLNDLAVTGDATAVELAEAEWGGGNIGLHTVNFVYDGSGDIVVRVGSHRNGKTGWHRADVSSIEIVPEPATMILLSLGGLIGLKRRQ